jgi:membrane-associated protein
VPIVRTFAPFVAGIGRMPYLRYLAFCIGGAVLWVGSLTLAGFFFGNQEIVRNNLGIAIVTIVLVSVLPMAVEFARARRKAA